MIPSPASVRPGRWSDLRLRVVSAAILAPIALGCIWVGGGWFAGLLAVIAAALAHEWLALCRWRLTPSSAVLFASLPVSVIVMAGGAAVWALLVLAVASAAGSVVARRTGVGALAAFGIPYLGIAAIALVWLREAPDWGWSGMTRLGLHQTGVGQTNVIVLLLIVWASDIGAYIAGRALGGRKLAPSISPSKTVSGAVGGLAAAMAVGLLVSLVMAQTGPLRALALAGLTGCVAQAGDLFESALKRHFGVKDSGRLIPGHGGVLDRLDALIAAAPFAALLALILGRGVVIW